MLIQFSYTAALSAMMVYCICMTWAGEGKHEWMFTYAIMQ